MRAATFLLLVAALVCACPLEIPGPVRCEPASRCAAPTAEPDAGVPDAGFSDAGFSDAGADPTHVVLAATQGMLAVPFGMTINGQGSLRVGQVSMAGNLGVVEVEGVPIPAVAYARTEFPGYVLFQTLAVQQDRWVVLWLYCQGSQFTDIYLHTTDGTPTVHETASGACEDHTNQPRTLGVALPAVDMVVAPLRGDFHVEGEHVLLDGPRPGTVRLGGRPMTVLPYNLVDCSTACGSPGWQEIHSILWDAQAQVACFAIFYLFPTGEEIILAYSLSLPDLSEPASATRLTATWYQLPP